MEDIKVGEFVRTKNNGIKRIDTIFKNKTVNKYGYECDSDWDGKWYSHIKTTDIVKHSTNIIDLIEVGDYVNGRKVYQVGYNFQDEWVCKMSTSNYEDFIYPKDIKSILTHEQFKNVNYEV